MGTSLHHAYLLEGTLAQAHKFVREIFSPYAFEFLSNPDFLVLEFETLGIGDAREIHNLSTRHSFSERKVFLISCRGITLKAQNALLKTLEDPPSNTHFCLVVREAEIIIPTLLSRVMKVDMGGGPTVDSVDATAFLTSSLKERLNFATKFADREGDLVELLDQILLTTRDKRVYEMRRFANDRSVSRRLILEHLALML